MVGGLPVCDNQWDAADGEVVCRQLGYIGLDRVTIRSAFGHRVPSVFAMSRVECSGEESSLEECPHNLDNYCNDWWGAGVVCLVCPRIEFGCYSGGCVPHASLCDGTEDCSDGSDEREDYCTRPSGEQIYL